MKVGVHVLEDTLDGLVSRLEKVKVTEKGAEWTSKATAGLSVACFFLAIVAAFKWGVFGFPLVVLVVAALVAACVGLAKVSASTGQYDLDDVKLHSLLRLLKVLRADVPAAARVSLTVDFRDYKAGGQSRAKGQGPPVHRQTWLTVKAPLADGSLLLLELSDQVRRKEKSKRKYTKISELWAGRVDVLLRLGRGHGAAEAVAGRLGQLKAPEPLACRRAVGKGRSLQVQLRLTPTRVVTGRGGPSVSGVPEGRAVGERALDARHFCYRGLHAARRAA